MTAPVIDELERAAEAFIAAEQRLTSEVIRDVIARFRVMFTVTDEQAELLARRIEVRHAVTMRMGSVLTARDYVPWLEGELANLDFYYWNRYRRLLEDKKFPASVRSILHSETDRVLGLLQNPKREAPWRRQGMVVGHVQSGKTANYIGLISKAADAGYKLIVVIAGIHNNLRNQTQKRIDEGFVGRDSARLLSQGESRYIGVGRFDATRRPITFTNSLKDFSKEMATGVGVPLQNLTEPAVLVIKKNSATLRNLLEWLREHNSAQGGGRIGTPMLLIDDEADNASINVSYGRGEVSRINQQIRDILQLFDRCSYVGYTATPFANIFIDPDTDDKMLGEDLFPRHFIVSLDPPSNYFGPDSVFGDPSRTVVRHIDDNEDLLPVRHTIDHELVALPPSLVRAVHAFVVGRAIRLVRGHHREHCSMLVNASRFTRVQQQLRAKIQTLVEDLQASIQVNGGLPSPRELRDPAIRELHAVWEAEYSEGKETWEEIKTQLRSAVAPIRVVEVNSRSHGTLNYDDYRETGLTVLAIGGYSLSRGLTLEGLMTSYFLRNSMMYDTLMQMGRWFGYRPEYEDLCRIWMPEEAESWYAHVADSINELREELRVMAAAGATPEEFGLKVRAHPDALIVTARNKMGSGKPFVMNIGLANQFVESAILKRDKASLESNRSLARALADHLRAKGFPLAEASVESTGLLVQRVSAAPIREFIGSFANHPLSLLTEPGPVGRYIDERSNGELELWDVLIPSIGSSEDTISDTSLGIKVNCQRRSLGKGSNPTTLRITNKQRVASRGAERAGLSREGITEAERDYREATGKQNYPDRIYRSRRERPLFMLHLVNLIDVNREPIYEKPVIAWSVSFPQTTLPESRVEYVVTTTWIRENFPEEGDDDEFDDVEV